MHDILQRLAGKNDQPLAEDRHAWLSVVEAVLSSGEHRDRLQDAFDCLVDPRPKSGEHIHSVVAVASFSNMELAASKTASNATRRSLSACGG